MECQRGVCMCVILDGLDSYGITEKNIGEEM